MEIDQAELEAFLKAYDLDGGHTFGVIAGLKAYEAAKVSNSTPLESGADQPVGVCGDSLKAAIEAIDFIKSKSAHISQHGSRTLPKDILQINEDACRAIAVLKGLSEKRVMERESSELSTDDIHIALNTIREVLPSMPHNKSDPTGSLQAEWIAKEVLKGMLKTFDIRRRGSE